MGHRGSGERVCRGVRNNILTPVFPIFKKGNYGGFLGRAYKSISDYRALVQEAAEKGADFIKLMLTGIMDFDRFGVLTGFSIPEDEMRELVNIAHGEGFAVMAHVNGTDPVKSAVDAGVDSVEHGNFADSSAVRALIDAGCVWVPTLAPTWNFVGKGVFPDEVLLKIEEFRDRGHTQRRRAGRFNRPRKRRRRGSGAPCSGAFGRGRISVQSHR